MRFTLYTADVTGIATNVMYPNACEISDPESLASALAKDNVCCRFRDSYRRTENIETSDCIVMDFDNDHTEDPDKMLTKEKLTEMWPDVAMAVAPSRNVKGVPSSKGVL